MMSKDAEGDLEKDRVALQRTITGALKDTINSHGVIDSDLIGSATKRIFGAISGNFEWSRKNTKQPK